MKILFLALLASFCFLFSTEAQKENKVLIVGLDGVRPDALQFANTPNIDKLTDNGTYSWDALNEGTTSSGPGWSNILTGVWQDKHGVTNNSFAGSNFVKYPPIFKYIEDHNPELHTVSICEWHPINNSISNLFADRIVNTNGPANTESIVSAYLVDEDPDVMFVHLDSPDGAGHGYGYSIDVPQYISTLEAVDTSIGVMLDALDSRSTSENENWLIILTTDHGGLGRSHGGNSIDERNVFFIASGDNVENKQIEKLIGAETEVGPANNCLLDNVELYFDGSGDHVQMPLNPIYDFGTSQDFSVEVRIRTTIAADVSIIGNKNWVTGSNKGFVFSFSGGTWKVNVGDGNSGTRVDVNGNNISDNEWHTLSATFDRDGDLKLFEDGILVGSASLARIGDITTGLPLSIGADGLKGYEYSGYIAEVRVYNTLLTAENINNWKCNKLNNTHPSYDNLIGYWRLVDGVGASSAEDLSNSKLNGTITNAIWEDATDSKTIIEYDYSETPRQVDVVTTALEHMCVPIDSSWGLDGEILGVQCIPGPVATGIDDQDLTQGLVVFPNAVNAGQNIHLKYLGSITEKKAAVVIYDNSGREVLRTDLTLTENMNISTQNLAKGNYNILIESAKKIYGQTRLKIN